MNRKKWKKASLALSAFLFVLWWALGTGATLAWFSDHDMVRNEFQIGLLKLDVSYKNDIVKEYTPLEGTTKAFNDEALYEPGYTQVVYLKINNRGNIPLDYKIVVHDFKSTDSINVYGDTLHLPDHLNFGLVTANTEQELQAKISPRDFARLYAIHRVADYMPNQEYSIPSSRLEVNCEEYAALIVWMPTKVGNEANYKTGETIPQVTLGVTVHAQQINTMTNE